MWIWPRYWPISSAGNLPSGASPPGATTVPWSQLRTEDREWDWPSTAVLFEHDSLFLLDTKH